MFTFDLNKIPLKILIPTASYSVIAGILNKCGNNQFHNNIVGIAKRIADNINNPTTINNASIPFIFYILKFVKVTISVTHSQ